MPDTPVTLDDVIDHCRAEYGKIHVEDLREAVARLLTVPTIQAGAVVLTAPPRR